MEKTDLEILIVGIMICALCIWMGFGIGRRYEQKFWTKFYTEEMEKTCIECAGIGK